MGHNLARSPLHAHDVFAYGEFLLTSGTEARHPSRGSAPDVVLRFHPGEWQRLRDLQVLSYWRTRRSEAVDSRACIPETLWQRMNAITDEIRQRAFALFEGGDGRLAAT